MSERYALYYAPPVTSPLWQRSALWLGRDAATGATIEADILGLDPEHRRHLTHAARRYGLHATLKAPMALDSGLEGKDLDRALKAWVATQPPVELGRLRIADLDGFLALVPVRQSTQLADFAARVVADFDGFRAPLSEGERQRRLQASALTPGQRQMLERYGYPYVGAEFRLHLTLTDRLPEADRATYRAAAENFFAFATEASVCIDRLVLFREAEPGAPFMRLRDYPLTGER